MLVAQIWVSQQGQSLILSQHDPISSWLCLTLLYVDTNHWSLISQTQTSNSVGLGDRHCDGFSQPTETIEICPISHGHGMGNHQAGIPSAQGESPNLTVTVCWLMQRHNPWYSKHFTLSPSPCLSLKPCGTASEDQSIWPSGPPLLSISRKNPGHADAPYLQSEGLGRYLYRAVCVHGVWLRNQGNHPDISILFGGQNCMIKMFWYSKHSRPKLNQSVLSLSISVRAFCWKGNLFIFFDAIFSTWTLNPLSSLGQVRRWSDVSDVSVNSTLHQLESFEASEPIMLSQVTTKNLSLQCKCARCSWGWLACVGLGRPQQAMCAVYLCWIG